MKNPQLTYLMVKLSPVTPGSGMTPALTIAGQHGIRGSKQDNRARKEIKGTHIIKEVKLPFLIVGRTFYIKNHINYSFLMSSANL